ncbi:MULTISPECIES: hypothetical protein [unclassified Thioalkalivibrio]|uniref:hypothetical protein n=1 Tax=unclassified Thioalkalivibrio TaxID=2621013 RepID=UPI00035CFD30|nr:MULTISPECIES: hypothetical protein [unclassified Thioalkalivibrio]
MSDQEIQTLREINSELAEALKAVLRRDERNTCMHEDTHRGGVLWEICDQCGQKWADDEGGRPEWEDPKEWGQARAALTRHERYQSVNNNPLVQHAVDLVDALESETPEVIEMLRQTDAASRLVNALQDRRPARS